jgi:hypothetical protein
VDFEPLKVCTLDEKDCELSHSLLFSPLLSDITFRIIEDDDSSENINTRHSNVLIPAHRQILALRCEYWRLMFSSGLRESRSKRSRSRQNLTNNNASSSSLPLSSLFGAGSASTGPTRSNENGRPPSSLSVAETVASVATDSTLHGRQDDDSNSMSDNEDDNIIDIVDTTVVSFKAMLEVGIYFKAIQLPTLVSNRVY